MVQGAKESETTEELFPIRHQTTRRVPASFVVLALVLFLAISACGPKFRLQAIDPELVPAKVRDQPPHRTDIVWRDIHEESGWYVAAFTYYSTIGGDDEHRVSPAAPIRVLRCYMIAIYTLGAEGKFEHYDASGSDLPSGRFKGGGGRGSNHIDARGVAFHPQAAKVIGTTSTGRTVKCTVSNGFWGLYVANAHPGEWWTSVNAVDADDRVLFCYWDGEHWQMGN